jgi:FkbM family methyltransferase
MNKISSLIYKTFVAIYKLAPLKKIICIFIKKTKIPNSLFYTDLKFRGKFKVKISEKNSFLMFHTGGTIENETFWNGLFESWENDTGWIWNQLCVFSNTIFDIGANGGIYSLVAKSINPKSKVYAFEPSRNTFDKLVVNNTINKYDIKCEQLAISNTNIDQVFYDVLDTNQQSASLSPEKLKNWDGFDEEVIEYNVKSMTLSNYIKTNNIQQIDLIKIDIEMHEPEAIEGFEEYLVTFKPVVIIEVLSVKVAQRLNQLIDRDNHIILHLKDNKIAEQKREFSVFPGHWNFIFFHKDLSEKIKHNTSLIW